MTIDPNTLPDGTAVETSNGLLCFKDGEGWQDFRHLLGGDTPWLWRARTIARAYVPVPDDMTYADAEAALADAGAWVEVDNITDDLPIGTRIRIQWNLWQPETNRTYIHRDDLPPADPDAELVEVIEKSVPIGSWVPGREVLRRLRAEGFDVTHEAKS